MGIVVTLDEARKRLKDKTDDWELVSFTKVTEPCVVQHKCGLAKTYKSYSYILQKRLVCDNCDNQTNWKYEIGDIIDNLKIINRKTEIKEKNNHNITKKYYQYSCLKCGFNGSRSCYKNGIFLKEHWIDEDAIVQGRRCACCHGTVVQTGINDVATTDPHTVKFFANKELSKKYSRSATKKIDIMCPICGFKNPAQTTIYNLVWEGVSCVRCGSSMSYPEKFIYFLLKQLDINFTIHKSFTWSNGREYDFYLCDYNVLIEAHGRQHYETPFSVYGKRGRTLEEEQNNDKLKKSMATENGYVYIEIDCRESNVFYISKSILKSELQKYLDLNNVDWDECNKQALIWLKMIIINDKKDNPNMSSKKLADKYGISRNTIASWLKQGADICGYDPKKELIKSNFYAENYSPVYSPELKMAFMTIKDAAKYADTFGSSISQTLSGKIKYSGKNPDTGEKLTWKRMTKEQYYKWAKQHKDTFRLIDCAEYECG